MDKSTIVVEDFNTSLLVIEKKEIKNLWRNVTSKQHINQLDIKENRDYDTKELENTLCFQTNIWNLYENK